MTEKPIKKYNLATILSLFSSFPLASEKTTPDAVSTTTTEPVKTSHNLTLSGVKHYNDLTYNVYYYERHTKCSTALFNFAKSLHNVNFIPLTSEYEFRYDGIPVIWGNKNESRGLIHKCWDEKIDFFHLDLPYIEDWNAKHKASSFNVFRLSLNGLHKNKIYPRKSDRAKVLLSNLGLTYTPFAPKSSNKVLIIPPSETMAEFYQIDIDLWIEDAIEEIRRHGMDYHVRYKPKSRQMRSTLIQDIDDACAMYVFNSNAGVESIIHGVPVISAPHAPTAGVSMSLEQIRNGDYINMNVEKWFNSIAYSQWNVKELISGVAIQSTLDEYELYRY